uniref:NADH-ubiquinone oxidoreductase chain 4 n=1 Tax=Linguatula arctica TaxID=1346601 RepID=A0A7G8QC95_9CRUS|nr:NADH dehydrogenase subunit 4 [Linguatula arctica]QNK04403.1 NADH dehydrogenase subunit 4 [Linguatula arctica]
MLVVIMVMVGSMMVGMDYWSVGAVVLSGLLLDVVVGLDFEPLVYGYGFLDYVSWFMLVMSLVLFYLMMMGSYESKSLLYVWVYLGMVVFVLASFMMVSFLGFYVMFEASMIPMVMILVGWGYQAERVGAMVYMMVYTVFSSLMMLVGLSVVGGWLKMMIGVESWGGSVSFLLVMVVFLVKLPMYGLHIWLPKAHVEASTAGSMILAGVLLKLGGYGLVRLMGQVGGSLMGKSWLVIVGLLGGIVSGLMCLRQVDLKRMVAYSSISHMSFIIAGFVSGSILSLMGMVIVMVGHGFSSSGLFYLSGVVSKIGGSRSIYMVKRWGVKMGGLVAILCVMNMSVPPSIGILGELMIYMGVSSLSGVLDVIMGVISFVVGGYSMYMYSVVGRAQGVDGGYVSLSDYYVLLYHAVVFMGGGSLVCLL